MRERFRRFIDDWTVLRYGWLAVFLIHIAFLAMGVFWLKRAWRMEDASLYSVPEVRISHVITAGYMLTIAFSIILLIITVFLFEVFKMLRRVAADVEEIRTLVGEGYASGAEGDEEAFDEEPPPRKAAQGD